MLARRAVSRSFSHLRHDTLNSKQTRAFSYLLPRSQFHLQARPSTLSSKAWYRQDGTPRSKLKGLIIGTIASATLYTLYSMMALVNEMDTTNYLLGSLVHIQRIDTEFPSVDVSDFQSMILYFQEMFSTLLGNISQEVIDEFFSELENLSGASREEGLKALRETCEEVHQILLDSKGEDPVETMLKVVSRLDDGLSRLVEMLHEKYGNELVQMLKAQRISGQVLKDPAAKSSEYEVVG